MFDDFSDDEITAICSTVTKRQYGRHEFIVRESDTGDAFYLVIRGSVAVCHTAPDGHETILSILKEGDFFGEMAMFDSSLRSASIKTLTEVEVGLDPARRRSSRCSSGIRASPGGSSSSSPSVCARRTGWSRRPPRRTRGPASPRCCSTSRERFGEPIEAGTRITLRLTHQEMANMIGTTRETVNRALNRFWDEHLVDRRSPLLVLTDLNGLRALL